MWLKKLMLPIAVGMLLYACRSAKSGQHSTNKNESTNALTIAKSDTSKTDTAKKGIVKLQPYNKVITAKAVSQKGLFSVHKVEERYYFELPDTLFDKDILVVNRIAKAATEVRPGAMGFAGDEISRHVIQFSKAPNNRMFIKRMSFNERSADSTENGLYRSLMNSNLQPVVASFDVKAISPDSTGAVIDMTDFINGDNDLLFFGSYLKGQFKLGPVQNDKSYIESIRSFPINIEIKTFKTFGVGEAASTYLLNNSIVLLPKAPMAPRYWDGRVGYFYVGYLNYDKNPQGVANTGMINRWKLEPKDVDVEKYKRGELVEPKKPIVYYIDPNTPKKWIPFLMQGVNDWQKAFEKAGFKNAIYALEAPKNDSNWSIEDARYSVIVYKPSYIANASGPNISDPRTGEILETHINWYHNVMQLLHDWYMIQAGPNDPRARKMDFDDSLMGQLIRFVSSHEVGHTLGLLHNFGASSSIPVEKLRDKKWVEENGFCPSIMDYARFNYVAQPEDNISEKGIFPRIGVYDEWAIEWGYKWLPELKTEKEQKKYMDKWVTETIAKDNRLWFGSEASAADPRCQSEDVGDDAMKAGSYGIKNLERVMNNLINWTKRSGGYYNDLARMQNGVIDQYRRYLFHAARSIGGRKYSFKTMDETGPVFSFLTRGQQKEALQFLQDQLFTTPEWLLNKQVFAFTGNGTSFNLLELQKQVIERLVSNSMFGQFEFAKFNNPKEAYTVDEMLKDLETGIWKEIRTHKPIDEYRRNLQKVYAIQLINVLLPSQEALSASFGENSMLPWNKRMDVHSIVKEHLKALVKESDKALVIYKDRMTRLHFIDMKERLKEALDPARSQQSVSQLARQALNNEEIRLEQRFQEKFLYSNWEGCKMWQKDLNE